MDSCPHTGLTVLVECLTSSRSNKIPFSISFVDSGPYTGLTVLDNWVFGFGFVGSLCCFQQLLNPILSSNYLCMKSWEVAEVTHILSRK